MSKQAGLGAAFYLGGNDLSGDINSLGKVSGGPSSQQDTTDITQSGHARLGLHRDGNLDLAVYFDPVTAHPVLSALPAADTIGEFWIPPLAIGSPVACLNAKQVNYDWTRAADGSLMGAVALQANGFGLEWGAALTAGKRTDTAATNGTPFDNLAGLAFGAQGYLQVFSFAGTDVTVKIQSATTSGGSYSDLITFTQVTGGAPLAQRAASASNATTVNEFLRAVTVTTGGFSSLVFAVMVNVNTVAGVSF